MTKHIQTAGFTDFHWSQIVNILIKVLKKLRSLGDDRSPAAMLSWYGQAIVMQSSTFESSLSLSK